ncbi:MAG: hypothetical protein EOO22_00855 [Comamonadaceae bacterium]|nr:MAG: hypothetical protein EOO22_00855 [Comamonadaceae bacterium]
MRTKVHMGRRFDAGYETVSDNRFLGVFDVDSTSREKTDGVINEATADAYATPDAAEDAAEAAAIRWIESEAAEVKVKDMPGGG